MARDIRLPRSRGWAGALAFGALLSVAGGHSFAQRGALAPECRQPLREQCAGVSNRRSCVMRVMETLPDTCRKQVSAAAAARMPRAEGMVEHAYGRDALQKLDLKRAVSSTPAPLIVFVHGGGWSIGDKSHAIGAKAQHFTARGFAFASVNYRLVPSATVEQQASDVAAAIGWLRVNAGAQGIDPTRIVVMGHSAGAHLAALVASDPSYLAAARVPFADVKAAVLLDGAAYDVPAQLASPVNRVLKMYRAAFGADPARHKALSPLAHAAAPNAPQWLVLAIAQRDDSTAQSDALAAALNRAGSKAQVVRVSGSDHGKLNRNLGTDGDAATAKVDAFLAGF